MWHRWQSRSGNATVVWHTPQDFPSKMSTIVYFDAPFFTSLKIFGWQSSQPFHTICFSWEKMTSGLPSMPAPRKAWRVSIVYPKTTSGLPSTFAPWPKSFCSEIDFRWIEIPSRKSTGRINRSFFAFSQSTPFPNRPFGKFFVKWLKSYSGFTFFPREWQRKPLAQPWLLINLPQDSNTFLVYEIILPLCPAPQIAPLLLPAAFAP